jgi:uncharacterized protein (DUF58 family)
MPPAVPQRGPLSAGAFAVDWGSLAPLRLRARAVAEGVFSGAHRSQRKGAGIEFGGQRPYVPGDDLRFFDRRALLRYDRLEVREYLSETERSVWLVVDATASMSFRGARPGAGRRERAPGAKVAYAGLVAAALARVAVSGGDPVALSWLGGVGAAPVAPTGGREGFSRVLAAVEALSAAGDFSADDDGVARLVASVAQRARRGAVVVVLSDLLDLPPRARATLLGLASRGRTLVVAQVLDPVESTLAFDGSVRLRAMEGTAVVETDAAVARAGYLAKLADLQREWRAALEARGGRLVVTETTDDPVSTVRRVLSAAAGAPDVAAGVPTAPR